MLAPPLVRSAGDAFGSGGDRDASQAGAWASVPAYDPLDNCALCSVLCAHVLMCSIVRGIVKYWGFWVGELGSF